MTGADNVTTLTLEQELFLALLKSDAIPDNIRQLLVRRPDWDKFIELVECHAVMPLCYRRLRGFGADLIPAAEIEVLRKRDIDITLINLTLRRELDRILRLFAQHKIVVVPIKGPLLAERVYGDIALRQFTDLDLLVHPDDAAKAVELLIADGYKSKLTLIDKEWPCFVKCENEMFAHHPDSGIVVEIHWACFHRKYAFCFDESELFCGRGNKISSPGLGSESLLLYLCTHGSIHRWTQWKWVVDVARLLDAEGASLDWNRLLWLSAQARAKRVLLLGCAMAESLCGTELPEQIERAVRNDSRVESLVQQNIECNIQGDNVAWLGIAPFLFFCRFRDNWLDRLKMGLGLVFCPAVGEWEVLPLPTSLRFLYWVVRPFHLLWRWRRE